MYFIVFYLLPFLLSGSITPVLVAPTGGEWGLGGSEEGITIFPELAEGSFPLKTGVTTAYFSKSSYSSRSPVDTELPRLSLPTSGEDLPPSPSELELTSSSGADILL